MEAENVVANQIVSQVQAEKPINVSHMEAENVVANQIVSQVQAEKPINVSHMEAETDVQIVLIGLIQELDVQNMMDTAQLVLSVFFQTMKEAKLYILIQKKLWLEMLSTLILKDLFMIDHYILVIVIAHIDVVLIIVN
jgi:hypothetical protein